MINLEVLKRLQRIRKNSPKILQALLTFVEALAMKSFLSTDSFVVIANAASANIQQRKKLKEMKTNRVGDGCLYIAQERTTQGRFFLVVVMAEEGLVAHSRVAVETLSNEYISIWTVRFVIIVEMLGTLLNFVDFALLMNPIVNSENLVAIVLQIHKDLIGALLLFLAPTQALKRRTVMTPPLDSL